MPLFSLRTSAVNRLALIFAAFSLLIVTGYLLIVARPVHAQAQSVCGQLGPTSTQVGVDTINKCAIEKDIFDDKLFNLNQMLGTIDSLNTMLSGESALHPETNQITKGQGALAAGGSLVASLYSSPPVSGVSYVAGEFRKFNPVQPAYAQEGIGFDALTPVQGIWRVFRNASYAGFVIVFVILGFMIMFRAKIAPQTVANIQDSIPRLVIALILVTFSYAIAGFMIDLMFLLLNIAINLLQASGLLSDAGDVVFRKSVFGIGISIWDDVVATVSKTVDQALGIIVKIDVINWLITKIFGSLTGIIFGIAILYIIFRVFLMLLMAYVMIIILTMFAPFFFLIQALPGNNGARGWFQQMAANVAVFPAVALMFIFGGILGGLTPLGGSGDPIFSTQQIGQFPLFAGDLPVDVIGKLIGMGFLLMTPQAAELVKRAIGGAGGGGGGGAFGGAALGGAIGGALGAGAAPLGAGARAGWNIGYPASPIGRYFGGLRAKQQEAIQKSSHTGIYSKQYEKISTNQADVIAAKIKEKK